MRRREDKLRLGRLTVAPCPGLILYVLLVLAAFVFAQAYRDVLPAALLTFILIFGLADVILLLITLRFVIIPSDGGVMTVERGQSLTVSTTVYNEGVLPVSSIAMLVGCPTDDPMKRGQTVRKTAVPPFSKRSVTVTASAIRRGTAETGVTDVYIYDMLRLLRIKVRIGDGALKRVTALPKRLPYTGSFAERDGTEDTSDSLLELSAMGDYGDVREYRPGDSMKQIHWKLSTKSEELQVRKHSSETERNASVFLDAYVGRELFTDGICYLEAVDRLFDEAYTVACEASDMGYEGLLTVGENGAGIRFGSKADNEKLAAYLSGMGYSFEEEKTLPAGNDGSNIYVLPFTGKGSGAVFTERLRTAMTSRSSVRAVSLEDLIPEENRKEYKEQLGHFLEGISALGVTVTVAERGGENRG